MTHADRIAELEAQLEIALREADDERSTREALDRDVVRLKAEREALLSILGGAFKAALHITPREWELLYRGRAR